MPDDHRKAPSSDERYPGYDVLSKRSGPSWNEQTRRVITQRLAVNPSPSFFTATEFEMVRVIAAHVIPQPVSRPPVAIAALIDHKLAQGACDGYREQGMPHESEAWRLGLEALDAEAVAADGGRFCSLADGTQLVLLQRMERGDLHLPLWGSVQPAHFFKKRMAKDIVFAYYAHPTAWNEIGWGGPASPRGYVRLDFDARDPWEAAEAKNGDHAAARRMNSRVR